MNDIKPFREWLDDSRCKDSDIYLFLKMVNEHEKIAKRRLDMGSYLTSWWKYVADASFVFHYDLYEKESLLMEVWRLYILDTEGLDISPF